MRIRAAFDVSGLEWRYRTGVQNLYWAYVNAWTQQPELADEFDVLFYDRSGAFNRRIADEVGDTYLSCAPGWWPRMLRRPLQALVRATDFGTPKLAGAVNHVWNWSIFNPSGSIASITIPDVLPLEYPHWFSARFRRITNESLRFATNDAGFVFAISAHVRRRIIEVTGLPPDRVRVVYPGVGAQYFSHPRKRLVEPTLRKHGLAPGRYLLSSGFLHPRKNLASQLSAFAIAVGRGETDLKYALTGVRTALSEEIIRIIESPSMRSRVIFLGYVSQDELIVLMSQAAALMYCSLAEGFGLPIIEAMAVGTPVITSATTSMQELADSRARLVNPNDIGDIALAIEETLGFDAAQRQIRINANKTYARQFTIDRWLRGHLNAYAEHRAA